MTITVQDQINWLQQQIDAQTLQAYQQSVMTQLMAAPTPAARIALLQTALTAAQALPPAQPLGLPVAAPAVGP